MSRFILMGFGTTKEIDVPIYEYKCLDCGNQFEKIHKYSDSRAFICEKCGSRKTERVMSLSSFRLKGNGWYETDFKTKKLIGDTE